MQHSAHTAQRHTPTNHQIDVTGIVTDFSVAQTRRIEVYSVWNIKCSMRIISLFFARNFPQKLANVISHLFRSSS
jgi:hypothetical protein